MKKSMTASEMGKKGGRSRSEAKRKAAQRNGLISAIKRKLRKQAENSALK